MQKPSTVLILFLDQPDVGATEHAQNVARLIGEHCLLQVVNVNDDPDLAEVTGIQTTPTLVRLSPDPRRKVTGNLANHEEVARYLGAEWRPRPIVEET